MFDLTIRLVTAAVLAMIGIAVWSKLKGLRRRPPIDGERGGEETAIAAGEESHPLHLMIARCPRTAVVSEMTELKRP